MSSPITQWRQAINGILLGIAVDEVRNEATTESRGKAQEAITSATIELLSQLVDSEVGYIPEGHDRNACLNHDNYTSACCGCQKQKARLESLDNLRQSLKELKGE